MLRSELAINSQVSVVTDASGKCLYVKAGNEGCALLHGRELWSFGSGTWLDGKDAEEAMQTPGKWLRMRLFWDSMVIVDKKKVPQHLASLPIIEKATSFKEVVQSLEDMGEAWWV